MGDNLLEEQKMGDNCLKRKREEKMGDNCLKQKREKTISWSIGTIYTNGNRIISHHTLFYLQNNNNIYRLEGSNRIYRGNAICCISIHNGNSIYYNTTTNIPKHLLTYALRTSMDNPAFLHHKRISLTTEIKFDILPNKYLNGIVYTATENIVGCDLLNEDNITILKHNVGEALAKLAKVVRFVKKWILEYQEKKHQIETIRAKLAQYVQDNCIKFKPLLRQLQKSMLLREFIKLEEDMIKFVKNKIEDAEAEERWAMALSDKNA